jgi:ATP-dependent Clp protease adaptor protein ClpS
MWKIERNPSNPPDQRELAMGEWNAGSGEDRDSGLATSSVRPKLAQPPLYKVVLFNDDYTPMEFVVDVLCSFFAMNVEKATQIMLKVHTEGKAVCGVFSRDVAETKAQQVNDYSRECEQPLLCNVEVDR